MMIPLASPDTRGKSSNPERFLRQLSTNPAHKRRGNVRKRGCLGRFSKWFGKEGSFSGGKQRGKVTENGDKRGGLVER